tara:strand:- start:15695 stop:16093 length:399 start_codon:yes stop_codon:yes gene_type:complete
MSKNFVSEEAYKTIGQVAKELDLVDKKTGHFQTHTLRYWETQFKQIKPSVKAGGRRYYSKKDFEILKLIKFLLREKGLTINGVKKVLNSTNIESIDEDVSLGLYKPNLKNNDLIKNKIKKIYEMIKELKKYK